MFGNSRPRVPSSAALRVLYQLAYISSGTAAGLAALCAEERRRRTHVVQKIADNARRIRQSPRYVHNVAMAAEEVEDDEASGGVGVSYREATPAVERAPRTMDLPSRVEKGYEQLAQMDYKGNRTRPSTSAGNSNTALISDQQSENARHYQIPRPQGDPAQPVGYRVSAQRTPEGVHRAIGKHVASSVHLSGSHAAHDIRLRRSNTNVFRNQTIARRAKPAWLARYIARTQRDASKDELALHPVTISADVEEFFRRVPWTDDGLAEGQVANALLQRSLKAGTLSMIRSLFTWKLVNVMVHDTDIRGICDACRSLALHEDHEELCDFYGAVFASDLFCSMPAAYQLSAQIHVIAEVLPDLPHQVTWPFLQDVLRRTPMEDLVKGLSKFCEDQTTTGAHNLALETVQLLMTSSSAVPTLTRLRDEMFSAAVKSGHLWSCSRSLRSTLADQNVPALPVTLVEKFIRHCVHRSASKPLSAWLPSGSEIHEFMHQAADLSDDARVALAIACTTLDNLPETLFEALVASVPLKRMKRIKKARTKKRLRLLWNRTHNFDRVLGEFKMAKDFLARHGDNRGRFDLDLTMIEICNSANRSDAALDILSKTNRSQTETSRSLSLVATSLAAKGAWEQVSQLLELLTNSQDFRFDSETTQNFNHLLHMHLQQHTAIETWHFADSLINNLQFLPTQSTSMIILRGIVVDGTALDLIPRWFERLQDLGRPHIVDTQLAVHALRAFYMTHRPRHFTFFWLCELLTREAPHLRLEGFLSLLKDAVGYDIRNNKAHARQRAVENLNLLCGSSDEIPEPVRPPRGELHVDREAIDEEDYSRLVHDMSESESHYLPITLTRTPERENLLDPSGRNHSYGEATDGEAEHCKQSSAINQAYRSDPFRSDGGNAEAQSEWPGQSMRTSLESTDLDDAVFDNAALALDEPSASEHIVGLPEPMPAAHDQAINADPDKARKSVGHVETDPKTAFNELVLEMNLASSLRDFRKVMDLYYSSLGPSGLPSSPLLLSIAVEASIRLHAGDRTVAEHIMRQAQLAGMNVTSAMANILMHQIWNFSPTEKRNFNNLRLTVLEYNRVNEEEGGAFDAHLTVTAANVLINNHRPEYGINLLNAVYNVDWAPDQLTKGDGHKFSIVVMGVYLKGFTALRSITGVRWVVETILEEDLPISDQFMKTLNRAFYPFFETEHLLSQLRLWRDLVSRRCVQQRKRVIQMGATLVETLLACVDQTQAAKASWKSAQRVPWVEPAHHPRDAAEVWALRGASSHVGSDVDRAEEESESISA